MNPSSAKEAEAIFRRSLSYASAAKRVETVICPPFPFLYRLKKISGKILLGGQNVSSLSGTGAFTGEVSAEMLYDAGARYVILGHSERRAMGEMDIGINKKVRNALSAGLRPILCVGEKERDSKHEYFNLIKKQVSMCLDKVARSSAEKIIIAYEPVWAISTTENRRDASPEDFAEMAIFIRRVLSEKFGVSQAGKVRILYGGSVTPRNALSFLKEGGADGLLVGHDSLNPKKFGKIIQICDQSGNSKI